MVRTYAGIPGKNLMEAIDLTNETFGLAAEKQVSIEDQNEQSLKQLGSLMRGVSR